ncbi:cytidine deaminase-like protein [Globomyces pollinis-pini]|nr:cytidine deaminase-like protein [Globomyces pollinis-pini]
MSESLNWIPILSIEKTRTLETIKVYIISISNKKTQSLLKLLDSKFPLKDLYFLKRIQKLNQSHNQLIVCKECDIDLESLNTILNEFEDYSIDIIEVSKYPALTRSQFDDWRLLWPMTFHITPHQDELNLSESQSADFYFTKLSLLDPKLNHGMIVNPKSNTIVTETEMNSKHPLNHTVMLLINNVSQLQLQRADELNASGKRKSSLEDYLCNGFDLYIANEPCTMCTMALVHSRIRRVFYVNSYKYGALGSQYQFHTHESLNHHFQVWKRKCDE